jgi:hypothetical protein
MSGDILGREDELLIGRQSGRWKANKKSYT